MAASTVRFADVSNGDGGTRLHFEVPRLGEAAEELYRQKELFKTKPNQTDTGFDLLGDLLRDIREQQRDSYRFDTQLLRQVGRFRSAEKRWGVESLTLHGDRLPKKVPATIDKQVSELASSLAAQTPAPARARITGKLDMIRASDGTFSMILDTREAVQGLWLPADTELLKEHWRELVVVEGNAVFRASGSLLRIEAQAMSPAAESDMFFSVMPEAAPLRLDTRQFRQPQTPKRGVGAIFGKWPGDESEEELLVALKGKHR